MIPPTSYGARVLGTRPIDLSVALKGLLTVNFDRKKVKSLVSRYFQEELAGKKYAIGDTLILSVREGFYDSNRTNTEFFGVKLLRAASRVGAKEGKEQEVVEMKRKQTLTLLILFTMVFFVSTSLLELLPACMSAAFALGFFGCLTKNQAMDAVSLRSVLTIVGAFGLGEAISETKVATVLA